MTSLVTLDRWVKFTSTTVGRDKLYRTVQYLGKLILWFYQRQPHSLKDVRIQRLKRLVDELSLSRKLFRIGKPLDFLQALIKSSTIKDNFIRYCTVGRSSSLGLWLLLDSLQWYQSVCLDQHKKARSIATFSARFWLSGLVFSLAMNIYKLDLAMKKLEVLKNEEEQESSKVQSSLIKNVMLDIAKDGIDMLIPGSIAGYTSDHPALVSMAGITTSVIGIAQNWPK